MSWAGPGTSAAPTGPPWSWAAAQPHLEAEGALGLCRSHGKERTRREQTAASTRQGQLGWSKMSRQHGLASGAWKWTLGLVEIQAKQGDAALNCHRPHFHTCSSYINTRAKSLVVHSSSHTCTGRVSLPSFLPKHTWVLHQSVTHHFYVTDLLWCLFQNFFFFYSSVKAVN